MIVCRLNKNPWETAPHGLHLREVDLCQELRAFVTWARLSLEHHQDTLSYCSVVFPIVDSYSQFEKKKYARIKKRKRKGSLPMVTIWKRNEVLHYQKHSWMTDAHWELSRITQAFCLHVTHLEDAFSIREIWQMIATLKSLEVSSYVKEYGLQWIDTSTERVVLPTHSSASSTAISDPSGSGFALSLSDFPFLPPDLVEEASINAEDVRLIQNKAHKKRKYDHSQSLFERDSSLEDRSAGASLPAISCDRLLPSTLREVQEILHFTLPSLHPAAASSSSSTPTHPLLDANKEFLSSCSSLSVLAGKCALKLLTTPDDMVASNLLMREFNCHGRDAMMSYETSHPFEKLHLRQFLKLAPPPPSLLPSLANLS